MEIIEQIRFAAPCLAGKARFVNSLTNFLYRHSTAIIPQLEPSLRRAAIDSYADALRVVFICQAAINFLGFIACLPIQENALP